MIFYHPRTPLETFAVAPPLYQELQPNADAIERGETTAAMCNLRRRQEDKAATEHAAAAISHCFYDTSTQETVRRTNDAGILCCCTCCCCCCCGFPFRFQSEMTCQRPRSLSHPIVSDELCPGAPACSTTRRYTRSRMKPTLLAPPPQTKPAARATWRQPSSSDFSCFYVSSSTRRFFFFRLLCSCFLLARVHAELEVYARFA